MSNTLVRQHAARQRRHHLEHRVVRETTRLVSARTAAWLLRDVLRQAIDIPDFGRALPMPEECIIALTTLRAWQYRVWITLGKPSGPFILDHIPSAPPKRRVSRPRKLKPDGSFYKRGPPSSKIHSTGRSDAATPPRSFSICATGSRQSNGTHTSCDTLSDQTTHASASSSSSPRAMPNATISAYVIYTNNGSQSLNTARISQKRAALTRHKETRYFLNASPVVLF